MRFRIDAAALTDATNWALKGISPRPPVPVLTGMVIEATQGMIELSGFDYTVSARATTAADVERLGREIVNGRQFAEIVAKMPRKTFITVDVADGRAAITSGRSKYTLSTFGNSDYTYPDLPVMPKLAGVVDGHVLSEAIGRAKVAASTDGSLPVLMGVHIVSSGNMLSIEATDRYRLVRVEIPWRREAPEDVEWLIRAKTLEDAVKMAGAGEIEIRGEDQSVGFVSGNRALTTLVLDGDYPKIGALFPANTNVTVTFDRTTLLDAVNRAGLVAERDTPLRFTIDREETTLDSGTGDGAQGREYVDSSFDGSLPTPLIAAYNPHYMADALSSMPDGDVHVSFVDTKKPTLITPVDVGHGFRHLVMPVRL